MTTLHDFGDGFGTVLGHFFRALWLVCEVALYGGSFLAVGLPSLCCVVGLADVVALTVGILNMQTEQQ